MYDEIALQLIEYDLQRSYRKAETTETVSVRKSFARLTKQPVIDVIHVTARKKEWVHSSVFGDTSPTEIPLNEIEYADGGIILPQTLWGGYDQATVTYSYGHVDIPADIQQAVELLTERLRETNDVNRYTAQLLLRSDDIETLLKPYRTHV